MAYFKGYKHSRLSRTTEFRRNKHDRLGWTPLFRRTKHNRSGIYLRLNTLTLKDVNFMNMFSLNMLTKWRQKRCLVLRLDSKRCFYSVVCTHFLYSIIIVCIVCVEIHPCGFSTLKTLWIRMNAIQFAL